MELVLPARPLGWAEPLVATGSPGHGDSVFIFYAALDRIRIGWQSTADGVVYSAPVAVDREKPHHLLIGAGSLVSSAPKRATSDVELMRRLLFVELDGQTVFFVRGVFQDAGAGGVAFIGANQIGSALLHPFFTGKIVAARPVEPGLALAEALQVGRWSSALPEAAARFPGAVGLQVHFPVVPDAAADPLIVTGHTGKGDFLYAQIVDAHHVRFGFDHWAVGGLVSPPIEIDLKVAHDLVLTMGSLYRPGQAAATESRWRDSVAIWLDGRLALAGRSPCHPTNASEIILGYNLIGGSTTGPEFRGQITAVAAVTPAMLATLPAAGLLKD